MKWRNFIFICLLNTFFLLKAEAQFTLNVEYDQLEVDVTGLNGFVDSFNDFWGNKLSAPYEQFESTTFSMPNFGAGFRFTAGEKFGFTGASHVLWGRKTDAHRTTWATGVVNEVETRVRDIRWNLTTGVHYKQFLFMEGFFGGTFRKLTLKHFTEYPDGSRSLSSEYKLNGLYTGTNAALELGIQVSIRISRVLIFGRYSFPMEGFPPGKGLVAFIDYESTYFPPTDFPTDYALYATDPTEFVAQDLGLKTDDFEGKRLAIGIEIQLF